MRYLFTVLLLLLASCPVSSYQWRNVKFGGGGYITGFTFHPRLQGLIYARTDVGGAYRRDPGSSTWIPLLDGVGRDDAHLMSVQSMAVDPNNDQKFYMACGQFLTDGAHKASLLRSNDRGATWSTVDLPFRLGGNEDGRGNSERLQVDPHLGSVLFLATNQDGLWRSDDAGRSWSRVTSCRPTSTTFVVFDPSSGRDGQPTPVLYVGVATTTGPTVLQSSDAGRSWSAALNQPTGLMALCAKVDTSGHLFVTMGDSLGPNGVTRGAIYRYRSRARRWDNITPKIGQAAGWGGTAVSAKYPAIMIVSTLGRLDAGDDLYRTTDRGQTWEPLMAKSTFDDKQHPWAAAPLPPYWMTDVEMDPFDDQHLLINTGYGLWETRSALQAKIAWKFSIDGIEETMVTALISPPTGAHLLMTLRDDDGARYDTDFDDVRGYFRQGGTSYSIDYAHNAANFVARTVDDDRVLYLSWDNGVNWSPVASSSPTQGSSFPGKVAISASGRSLLWVPGGTKAYYSVDNGKSWTASSGYPLNSQSYYSPIADRFVDAVFYTYDFDRGLILESRDGGRSFTTIYSGLDRIPSDVLLIEAQLLSVPTQQRDLWLATPNGLYHINGVKASAPVRIGGIQAASAIGFGAKAEGQTYPTLFVAGKKDDVWGLYRSTDRGASWIRIDDSRHRFQYIDEICGDQRVFGQVFVGTNGRGVFRGTI